MKNKKIINLESEIRKREAALIRECSYRGEYEQVNRIAIRRIWRRQQRTATYDKHQKHRKEGTHVS